MRTARVVSAVVALIAIPLFLVWRAVPNAPPVAAARPFYLERAVYENLPSNKLAVFMREVLARRSDGTTAYIEIHQRPAFPPLRKVNMVDGSAVWLLDDLRAKTSWPETSNPPERLNIEIPRLKPLRDCGLQQTLAGHDSVSGQRTAVGLGNMENGELVKFWLAPALACEVLRFERVEGTTTIPEGRALEITEGEPDSKLFDLGNAYAEVVPSELIGRDGIGRIDLPSGRWTADEQGRVASGCCLWPDAPVIFPVAPGIGDLLRRSAGRDIRGRAAQFADSVERAARRGTNSGYCGREWQPERGDAFRAGTMPYFPISSR
jgi:hypothetical protein